MTLIKSQDNHISVPKTRIVKTFIEHKESDDRWLVTATVQGDKAVVLARYSTEDEAVTQDRLMWMHSGSVFVFPSAQKQG